MKRRNLLKNSLLFLFAFIFGYSVKKEGENMLLQRIDLTKVKDKDGKWASLTDVLAEQSADTAALQRKQKNIFVDVVEDFGADPTGVKDSTTAFNAAVTFVAGKGGGEIHLPFGIYKGDITVSTSNITISGNGSLKGTLKLHGLDRSEMSRYSGTGGITVKGLNFLGEELRNAITLKWVFGVDIQNCTFNNCVKAISFEPIPRGQHCSRINISSNRFIDCNYSVFINYVKTVKGEVAYLVGDVTFNNNFCEARNIKTPFSNIYNLHMKGIDGLICKGNTFFFNPSSKVRKSNIYIELFNWTIIEGNNFFEAVEHGVYCKDGSNLTIKNNNVAWSKKESIRLDDIRTCTIGENNLTFKDDSVNIKNRTGILVENSPSFVGAIVGNTIYFPNEHAIKIVGSSHMTIANNVSRNKYSKIEPIKIDFTNSGSINVTGNTMTGFAISMAKVVAQRPSSSTVTFANNNDGTNNYMVQGVFSPAFSSFKNNSNTIDISNINLGVFVNTEVTTVNSIKIDDLNDTIVRFVTLYTYNGNTSISRSIPNVLIKGTTGIVNIPTGESILLMIYGGSIREVSRSFPVT
ncbi:right-handed parallel beta-helix repeat-containing protein [Bacillus sp. B4EP4a]|uniref:right-handed parallel beta-helix repeat-containing protein n=1 Tax=Bacillus sp. B4EP4a TaxID=2590665 RepID=UPI001152EFB4|nr:right-handed parallel beta-helix repeat-containing protein [Bacillus sp. B4EP4a]